MHTSTISNVLSAAMFGALVLIVPAAFAQTSSWGAQAEHSRVGALLDANLSLQGSGNTARGWDPYAGLSGGVAGQAWVGHVTGALSADDLQGDSLASDDVELSISVWPIFGMRWGLAGAGELQGFGWLCPTCVDDLEGDSTLTSARAGTWLVAQTGIVDIKASGSYGQPVSFSSRFWRPDQGMIKLGYGFGVPGILGIESSSGWSLDVLQTELFVEELLDVKRNDGVRDHVGRDASIRASLVEFHRSRPITPLTVNAMVVQVDILAVPVARNEGVWAEESSVSLMVDLIDVRGITGSDARSGLDFALGLSMVRPTELRVGEPVSEGSVSGEGEAGEVGTFGFRGWLGWGKHRRTSPDPDFGPSYSRSTVNRVSHAFGVGTFHRLDTTGFGVDYGGQARAELEFLLGEAWVGHTNGIAIGAQRVYVSDLAPQSLRDRRGDMTWMGRVEAGVSRPVAERLHLTIEAWTERSDRDDPTWIGRGPTLDWDFGLSAVLTARLF